MAVRDVLRKHGIPPTWITANPQWSTVLRRERGVHLHLMIREWNPRMFPFMLAIERSVRARILRLDPLSSAWLQGVSWKFELVDESQCPAMPHAVWWQAGAEASRSGKQAGPVRAGGNGERKGAVIAPAFMPTQPMTP